MSANIAFIPLNGNRYAVDLLNPFDAIAWGNRALALFGPSLGKIVNSIEFDKIQGIDLATMGVGEVAARLQNVAAMALASCGELKSDDVTALMTEALQRCYTPQNEPLSDMAVFNRWFREHPGDVYPLGVMALVRLVKDFFPSRLVTAASGLKAKTTAARETGATP